MKAMGKKVEKLKSEECGPIENSPYNLQIYNDQVQAHYSLNHANRACEQNVIFTWTEFSKFLPKNSIFLDNKP
jgi:hypothetical protein